MSFNSFTPLMICEVIFNKILKVKGGKETFQNQIKEDNVPLCLLVSEMKCNLLDFSKTWKTFVEFLFGGVQWDVTDVDNSSILLKEWKQRRKRHFWFATILNKGMGKVTYWMKSNYKHHWWAVKGRWSFWSNPCTRYL